MRVSRALGPLAAVPVAGLAATVCALAVLAPDDPRRLRGVPPAPAAAPPAPPAAASALPLQPPGRDDGVRAGAGDERGPGPLDPGPGDAQALAERRAVDHLLIASTSADDAVRWQAVVGLGRVPHGPEELAVLSRLVDDPAPDVASEAARALAASPEGRRALVGRLLGPDDDVGLSHLACADALRERGTLDEVPALVPWAAGDGPMAEAAHAAVAEICARAGVDSPLPPLEPPGEARPSRD